MARPELFARPADTCIAGLIGAPTMSFPATLARGGCVVPLRRGRLLPGTGLDRIIDLVERPGSES